MKTIEIIVQPDGATKIQTSGFTGQSCQQASRFLEKTLGKAYREQLTPEFFQTTTANRSEIRENQ